MAKQILENNQKNIIKGKNGPLYRIGSGFVDKKVLLRMITEMIGREDINPQMKGLMVRMVDALKERTYINNISDFDILGFNNAIKSSRKYQLDLSLGIVYCIPPAELGLIGSVRKWGNYFLNGKFEWRNHLNSDDVLKIRDISRGREGGLVTKAKFDSKKDRAVKEKLREDFPGLIRLDNYVAKADPKIYIIDGLYRLIPRDGYAFAE